MAIGNFLKSGTYSNIHGIFYDKHSRSLSFSLFVYSNSSKTNLVSSLSYTCQGSFFSRNELKSVEVLSPPVDPVVGDRYFVPKGSTGVWSSLEEKIVIYNGTEWISVTLEPTLFYSLGNSKYYSYDSSATEKIVEVKDVLDSEVWESYFSVDKIGGASTDILKQIYLYLKTREEFSGVLDLE